MTTIKLKRSSTQGDAPTTSQLVLGELAVNTFDGTLFIKKNNGSDSIEQFDSRSVADSRYLTSLGTALVDADFTSNGLMRRTSAGTYSTITDNSSNWDSAYTYSQTGHIPLSGSTSITGALSTTGTSIEAGRGTGSVAMTTNDGDGNANLTFNHKNGDADVAGNVGRIEVNVDSSTSAKMHLEVRDNAATGAVTINNYGVSVSPNSLSIHNSGTANTGQLVAGTATLSSLSAQNSESTSLMINSSGVIGTRELGSNAFNSTTIPTNNNQLTNGAGYTTNTGTVSSLADLGITATATEINKLDGVTASTTELNKLDGVTASTAELNKVDGLTATTTELNYVDGVTSSIQTQLNGKQPSGSYLTSNQTITLSGDVTGSGSTSITTTVVNDSHNHTYFTVSGVTDLNSVSNASNTRFRPFTTSFQATNRSGSNYNGGFEVGTSATNYGAQFVFEANAASTAPAYRNKINGTWGSWYRLAKTDSPQFTGQVRLTATSDVSLSSTAHAFQIGPSTGTNIAMDGNEIMARSNGTTSSLYLQLEGGAVVMNSSAVLRNSNSFYFHDFASDVPTSGQGYGAIRFGNYSTGSNIFLMDLDSGGAATVIDVNSKNLLVTNDTATKFTLNGNTGDFSATGNITAYSSDARLKENIKPIENALDKVMSLSGVTFDWSDKVDELGFSPTNKINDAGVLAQDVKAVLPQAVAPAPFDLEMDFNTNTTFSKSGENYLTVQYEKIVPLLIEAIKELQREIKNLKGE